MSRFSNALDLPPLYQQLPDVEDVENGISVKSKVERDNDNDTEAQTETTAFIAQNVNALQSVNVPRSASTPLKTSMYLEASTPHKIVNVPQNRQCSSPRLRAAKQTSKPPPAPSKGYHVDHSVYLHGSIFLGKFCQLST